jgi:hypothetical protein
MERDDAGPDEYECQACGSVWMFRQLGDIQDLDQRVSPGEPVPAGECPELTCGALCHPVQLQAEHAPSRYVINQDDDAPAAADSDKTQALVKALQVLVLHPTTRAYLQEHDPKALQQACKALHDAGERYRLTRGLHSLAVVDDICWYCFAVLAADGSCSSCREGVR